jgi:predicted GNAT family N-acyltransferase
MIQGKLLSYGDDLSEAFQIRRDVFVNEMSIPEDKEFDEIDQIAMHAIAYEEEQNWNTSHIKRAVATGRVTYDGSVCQLSKIAVLKAYRKKKYGDFIVRLLLNKAFTSGIKEVILYTPKEAIDFFKTVGFKETGDTHLVDEISQYRMSIHLYDVVTACSRKTI